MKLDLSRRLGFLCGDVAKRYGERFDQLAREQIGLSRAQCRLLAAVAMNEGEALTQAALAAQLELSPMGVTSLCDRMQAAGWIRREPSASDRRANQIHLEPSAEAALRSALGLSDQLQSKALAGLDAGERKLLIDLLSKVQSNLKAMSGAEALS